MRCGGGERWVGSSRAIQMLWGSPWRLSSPLTRSRMPVWTAGLCCLRLSRGAAISLGATAAPPAGASSLQRAAYSSRAPAPAAPTTAAVAQRGGQRCMAESPTAAAWAAAAGAAQASALAAAQATGSATPAGGKPLPVVLVVAVALLDGQGRVLLAQRPPGKKLAGLWEFPGKGGEVEDKQEGTSCPTSARGRSACARTGGGISQDGREARGAVHASRFAAVGLRLCPICLNLCTCVHTPPPFSPAGGKVDAGESPEAALVRELAEELGIEVRGWAGSGGGGGAAVLLACSPCSPLRAAPPALPPVCAARPPVWASSQSWG